MKSLPRIPVIPIAAALVAVVLLAGAPRPVSSQAILNVERLEPRATPGWNAGVEGSLDLARGNNDHTNLLAGLALAYRWPSDWLRLFTGINYSAEGDGGVDNDRYLHVRYNHWWRPRVQSFHFVQAQASHSGKLQARYLVGSGIRLGVVKRAHTTLDVGSGLMFEHERLDAARITDSHPALENTVRVANLLVLNHQLSRTVRFVGVGYYQPRVDDLGDSRTLGDLSLYFALTEHVELANRLQWRHDTQPPGGVKADDVAFTSGFTVTLR